MNASDNNSDNGALRGWVPHGSGYEMTRCRHIIVQRLRELKQRKIPIVLVHEKYQSGTTLLLGSREKLLLLDKPLDWPGTHDTIRAIHRGPDALWNHFYSKVVKTDSDTLYITVPSAYFMLQRRENYRIDLPSGSMAAFLHKNTLYSNIAIKDLSAGGMLLTTPQASPWETGDSLEEIILTLPLEGEGSYATLPCKGAGIVRTSRDTENHYFLYAVQFLASNRESEAIIRYVRQRELELLRKAAAAP